MSVPSYLAKTEFWDGSSWTEIGDLSTAKGNYWLEMEQPDAFAVGNTGSYSTATEDGRPSTFTQFNIGQVYFNSGTNTFKITQQTALLVHGLLVEI